VIALASAPAAALPVLYASDQLGANPIEALAHYTGEWTLRLLILTLAVTPLRWYLGWSWLAPQRRTLGLFSFFYACLHFSTYIGLDLFFDFSAIAEDVVERPYITVGFASFVMMLPLALTSTNAARRRLRRRWDQLHRLSYLVAIGGIIHFTWLVKADLREPLLYGLAVALLLGLRIRGAPRARK
jgi:sulfoxide reductase heme-binding subunit YedZ